MLPEQTGLVLSGLTRIRDLPEMLSPAEPLTGDCDGGSRPLGRKDITLVTSVEQAFRGLSSSPSFLLRQH